MRVSDAAAESNVGRKRRHNEDNFVAAPRSGVFAVADGMGGAQAGEVASAIAAATVTETELDPSASGEERVVALIKAANMRVHARATADIAASGMGTTMTVAMLQSDGSVAIGHVGDSRAYRLRDGRLEQLTDDHSLVAELVRRGELSPEEAAVHPQRSVITRALGTEADVDVDAFTVDAREGDLFLLCSDGLTTMVAVADGDGDGEQTGAFPAPAPPPDPDEEDTLHPEDNVRLPEAVLSPPAADITMVVSADELAKALERPAPALGGAGAWPALTAATAVPTGIEPSALDGAGEAGPEAHASMLRILVAVLVIAALAAALDALPR
jgi:serine/threonine protein phosphatase PrpC